MELTEQTDNLLQPKKDETFFDKYIAGEKTKGMFNPTAKDVVDVGTDFIPGVSETKDIISLGTNINKGEYSSAGIDLASLVIGAFPVVGDVARRGLKRLTKNIGKSEDIISKQADEVGESLQKVYGNIEPPKKTVKAYKLFKTDKKGNLYPLFVKMQGNKALELNKWTKAEAGEINPKTGKVKSSLGDLAYRPGFHGGDLPIATHIGGKKGKVSKPNYRKDNQVWAEVEFGNDVDWQSVANSRALKNKDGSIQVKTAHITDQVPEGGVYRYKTNPNMTGNWLIGGELKINRVLSDKEVKKINNKAGVADLPRLKDLKLAEGGTIMKKQMEMFEDGGLKDEGGMVDEVSGNDVPTGSTREEVRDDIPAQLSEGEFVFPADVVRYIGLEKLMMMRQEAKQGLKQMEAMGQMGNSDEATMPDDLPFDETDLDIEDDLEYNVGGYVAPQVPMGTGQPYTPNVGKMYTPTAQPYAPASYKQLLGTSAAGAPQTKNVRYFNQATGQTRMIPHILNPDGSIGNTLYPVPQGFIRQDEAPKEEAKTVVESTKVAPVDAGSDDGGQGPGTTAVDPAGDPLSYSGMFDMDNLDKQMSKIGAMQLSTLGKAGIAQGVLGAVTGTPERNQMKLGAITPTFTSLKEKLGLKGKNLVNATKEQRNAMAAEVERVSAAIDRLTTNITFSKDEKGNTVSTESNKSTADVIAEVNAMADKYGLDKIDTKSNINLGSKIGQKVAEINQAIQDQPTTDMTKGPDVSIVDDPSEPVSDSTDIGDGTQDPGGSEPDSGGGYGSDTSGTMGGEDVAKGSLITKRKASGKVKPKYMKRGGLASKK